MTIEFRDVHASYDANTPILRGVSFTVNDGEFVAFVGTNGAGKSTTMRLMNGLLKPERGEVLIDGVPTTQLKTSELARRVGFLFQNPDSQICCNTVREELLFGFRALKMDMAQAERRVDDIIAEFNFNPDDDPFLLNRGTRQLLALASIVVLGTPVVVLDEPTTGLDFRECVKVMGIIRRLHERGTTVVMVCHDMEVVADFADRVIVMSDGRVVDRGPTFVVLRNRRTLEAASLVPPQIVDVSMALSMIRPDLSATLVGSANTLNEMEAAVAGAVGMRDRVAVAPTYAPTAPGAEDADGVIGRAVASPAPPVWRPTSPVDPAGLQLNELLDAAYRTDSEDAAKRTGANAADPLVVDADIEALLGERTAESGDSLFPESFGVAPAPKPVDAIGFAVPGLVSKAGRNLVAPTESPSSETPRETQPRHSETQRPRHSERSEESSRNGLSDSALLAGPSPSAQDGAGATEARLSGSSHEGGAR